MTITTCQFPVSSSNLCGQTVQDPDVNRCASHRSGLHVQRIVRIHANDRTATISLRATYRGLAHYRIRLYGPDLSVLNYNGGKDLIFRSRNLELCKIAALAYTLLGAKAFAGVWPGLH